MLTPDRVCVMFTALGWEIKGRQASPGGTQGHLFPHPQGRGLRSARGRSKSIMRSLYLTDIKGYIYAFVPLSHTLVCSDFGPLSLLGNDRAEVETTPAATSGQPMTAK